MKTPGVKLTLNPPTVLYDTQSHSSIIIGKHIHELEIEFVKQATELKASDVLAQPRPYWTNPSILASHAQ